MTMLDQPGIRFPMLDVKCKDMALRRRQARASENINGIDYVDVKIERVPVRGKKRDGPPASKYSVMLYLLKPARIDLQDIEIDGLNIQEKLTSGHGLSGRRSQVGPDVGHLRPTTTLQITVTGKNGEIDPQQVYSLKLRRRKDPDKPDDPDAPLPGFDPLLSEAEFSFEPEFPPEVRANEHEWDIPAPSPCPPRSLKGPEIDYLAKDYASFRQLALDRLSLIMPDWRERHAPDLGVALVEVLAYVGDHLSYYQDAVATEAYLQTARRRISVRRHARLVDYHLHEGCNARALLCLTVDMVELYLDLKDVYFITDYGLNLPSDRNYQQQERIK